MTSSYEQIVLKAPFTLVKGFVLGYRQNFDSEFKYFFNRKSGIKRETLSEHIMQFFDMDQYCYLCLDKAHTENFLIALGELKGYGVEVMERSDIDHAEFSLDITVYNRQFSSECEKIIQFRDGTIELSNPEADEIFDETGSPKSHAYTYELKTNVSGPFEAVMDFYLSLKKSGFADFVNSSEIQLRTLDAVGS